MAEAETGWELPGGAKFARPSMCPPDESADGERLGRAGRPIALGRGGSGFTCGSRVPSNPLRAALRSHASVIALWRAGIVCHSAPHMSEWVPPAVVDPPQTHATSPSWPAK